MSVRRAPVGEITRSQRLREAKNSPLCLSRRDFDSRQTRNIGFDRFDSCAQHHATTAPLGGITGAPHPRTGTSQERFGKKWIDFPECPLRRLRPLFRCAPEVMPDAPCFRRASLFTPSTVLVNCSILLTRCSNMCSERAPRTSFLTLLAAEGEVFRPTRSHPLRLRGSRVSIERF
jgi:hypothetical protein